jgi:S-formylglutathione hydrolase FrmB
MLRLGGRNPMDSGNLVRQARRFAVACGVAALLGPSAANAAYAPGQLVGSTSFGLKLVAYRQLDSRLSELTFQTPNVEGDTRVRVLTPANMDWSGSKRYPVLYLLHGAGGDDTSWTAAGHAEALTAGSHMIVVIPSSGSGGGYIDWYNEGRFGVPRWETYHVDQLLPWVDASYPTIGARAARAVIGLSMGGYGAIEYAARHPDLFAAAESFSGTLDRTSFTGDLAYGGHSTPAAAYGSYATNEGYVRGHNPVDLATNLRWVWLALRTGNGIADASCSSCADPLEHSIEAENVTLHERLTQLGIPHALDDYGAGTHTWPYWRADLQKALADLQQVFAHPAATPAVFDYRSWDAAYAVWGWAVSVRRPDHEFSALVGAGRRGFTLTGSASAVVTTGRYFRPGRRVRVSIRGASGVSKLLVVADREGRLRIAVALGRANSADEYSPQAKAAPAAGGGKALLAPGSPGTRVYTSRVRF